MHIDGQFEKYRICNNSHVPDGYIFQNLAFQLSYTKIIVYRLKGHGEKKLSQYCLKSDKKHVIRNIKKLSA